MAAHPCESCHPSEVRAWSQSGMGRSLHRPQHEPTGSFTTASGTRFTVHLADHGVSQRIERAGEASEYPVAYVIGSGNHASGYLVQIGDHLFQSPLCYYTNRRTFDLAPGYERMADADFTRPVGEECLLCHSGRPLHIPGTANRYTPPLIADEAISCQRCHGPTVEHLRRPVAGSIVNPAKLPPAARDSVCEQCHLAGVNRILNPGKDFADFRPGMRLEEVFTVYVRASAAFKVISHAEQLSKSACARNSQGKLWCGTCHDPHPHSAATPQTYNAKCEACHQNRMSSSHTSDTNCIGCHMTRRSAQDGGHTVFTDHRISRRPLSEDTTNDAGNATDELAAWRSPDASLEARNLALAYVNSGIANRSPAQIVRGYRALTEVQKTSPSDIAVLKAIGRALLLGKQPLEALRAFEQVLRLAPDSAASEEDVGTAMLEAGQTNQAVTHLERALDLDPLLLSAATALEAAYRKQEAGEKVTALQDRMRRAMSVRTTATEKAQEKR